MDIVLDPLGTSLLDVDLDKLRPAAASCCSANAGGGQAAPLPPLGRLIGGNVAIAGFSMSRLAATAPERAAAALRSIVDLLTTGQLDIAITEVGSLDEVPAVHQALADGRGGGKYVASVTARNCPR